MDNSVEELSLVTASVLPRIPQKISSSDKTIAPAMKPAEDEESEGPIFQREESSYQENYQETYQETPPEEFWPKSVLE